MDLFLTYRNQKKDNIQPEEKYSLVLVNTKLLVFCNI